MLRIELVPTETQLAETKLWLKKERETTGEGFFCNWEVIERAYKNNLVLIGLIEDKPIGFMVYYFSAPTLICDIIEIEPSYRKRGFGKLLFLESLTHFKKQGAKKVEVDSINEDSAKFCRKLGFTVDNDPMVRSNNNLKLLV